MAIDKRSLELSVYEYLKRCSDTGRNIRAVGVITDKQLVFYSQILKNDYATHDNIAVDIENTIHPKQERRGWDAIRENNIHFFCLGPSTLLIDLPQDQRLSMSQVSLVESVLREVDKYNSECTYDFEMVRVEFYSSRQNEKVSKLTETNEIIAELKKMVTTNYIIDDEEIIGKKLDAEKIHDNIKYHIGLDKCKSIEELLITIFRCKNYYEDSYYRSIFMGVFPNYKRVRALAFVVDSLQLDSVNVSGINFTNIGDFLFNLVNKFFATKSIKEIQKTVFYLRDEEARIALPNYNLVSHLLLQIKEDDYNKLDELLKDSNGYSDFMTVIINYSYHKKKEELIDDSVQLKRLNDDMEKAEKRSVIKENRKELESIIDRCNKIDNEIFEKNMNISMAIINGASDAEVESMKKEIFQLKEEHSMLKQKFIDLSGIDYLPLDSSSLDFYANDFNAETYIAMIKIYRESIERLKKEIKVIEQTGLVPKEEVIEEKKGISR